MNQGPGGQLVQAGQWKAFAFLDGQPVTGQNFSDRETAQLLIETLG